MPTCTAPEPTTDPLDQILHDEIALVVCGRREGKMRSCARCDIKARSLIQSAQADRPKRTQRIASMICGSEVGGACDACNAKAKEILQLLGLETA
ncbi:hypothetical protein ACIP9H_33860 [Streptomyces sp. NPDC088732]|uniref:hypothetical protein n=1 Tax=Streptomyces sp. NPDC088732 TaxID=3365879 RepID=UPI00380EEDB2